MLELDGSALEGGGQIVRSAVALSAITETPIEIRNIRAGRDRPGLRYQHCAAVRAVSSVCNADVEGCSVGEKTLVFRPERVEKKDITVDIGTAGSIPHVLQAWLPVILGCGGGILLKGGTEVPLSLTIDYFEHVCGRILRSHGAAITTEILERGYYPRGGGVVKVEVEPSRIRPISLDEGSEAVERGVISCSSGLPEHVAARQAQSAASVLVEEGLREFPVRFDRRGGPGTGSSITMWAGSKGACALGKRGLPAEKVGESAGRALVGELRLGGEADRYLGDQLLLYLARFGGSYTSSSYTLHARTMIWLLEQFGLIVEVREGPPVEFAYAGGP